MTYLKTISAVGLLSATFFAAGTASNPPTSGAYVNDEQRFFHR